MWLACYTQEGIGEPVRITQGEVARSAPDGQLSEWNKPDQAAAMHATGFDAPIYGVRKQQDKPQAQGAAATASPIA